MSKSFNQIVHALLLVAGLAASSCAYSLCGGITVCDADTNDNCRTRWPDLNAAYSDFKANNVRYLAQSIAEACKRIPISQEWGLVQGGGEGTIDYFESGTIPLSRFDKNTWIITSKSSVAIACESSPTLVITKTKDFYGAVGADITCTPPPTVTIGFFNGVANTDDAAFKSLRRLIAEYGQQYKDTPLKYELFYNQTACKDGWQGKVSCLEDVAEVFAQRTREYEGIFANRWETFWDLLAARHQSDTSLPGRLLGLLGGGNPFAQWLDTAADAIRNLLASTFLKLLTLFSENTNYDNRVQHLSKLTQLTDGGSRLIMVAHSQGNLFVNSAFDGLKALRPQAQAQVVHVAPASPSLRGEYVLADIDLVINALRVTGVNSVPSINVNLPLSQSDPSGHGFEPTYLDKSRAAYARTTSRIKASLDTFVP